MKQNKKESSDNMPELPEVETVKRSLTNLVKDKIIKSVDIYHYNIIEYPSVEEFKTNIVNQKINKIERYGKWLIFVLDNYYLLSHLRMEGKYFYKNSAEPLLKHEHVVFNFTDDTCLRYMDVRKFGKMHLIKKEDITKIGPLIEMGLEPWSDKLDETYLKEKYKNKKLPIKTTLLDQSIIVGIGNIYADEILFLSKINPLRKSSNLTNEELKLIIKYTKEVLASAIEKGGSSIRTYTSVDGVHGLFQQELYVHTKKGEKCLVCNTIIEKTKVGGRGTYYCPHCQKFD